MARVLLVDDDPRIRFAVRTLLGDGDRHVLVGECDSLKQARRVIAEHTPDVLLLDLGLPDGAGTELLRDPRIDRARTATLVLTIFDDDAHIFDALRAGAAGYLLKDEIVTRLLTAIDELLGGGAPMSPPIARRVLSSFHPAPTPRGEELTARERQVLELLAEGATYDEIGQILEITTNTVRTYLRSTYEKLHVSSKAEAAMEAVRRGLVRRR